MVIRYIARSIVFCSIAMALMHAYARGDNASSNARTVPKRTITEITHPRISAYLDEMQVDEHFTGVAMVVQKGKLVHAKGYGRATEDMPNTVNTAFHVASVSKQFTSAAILQLVERGVIDLQGSINEYLPDRYRTPVWDDVWVHHLLSHSSGVVDYAIERDYYDVVDGFCLGDTVDGMIREAMTKALEFPPGSAYAYSNIGFTLLGEIVEEQTSTPFEHYLSQNILAPMGMASSRVHIEGHVPGINEASGYRWDEDLTRHVSDDVVSLPVTAPDGGLVTTLEDFLKWIAIYQHGGQSVLSTASIDLMTSPQVVTGRAGELDSYGYGLEVGPRRIGHSGSIVGFRSRFDYVPGSDALVVVFTNNTANDPRQIAAGLLNILLAREPEP